MVKVALCDAYFWEQPSVLASNAWWRRWTKPTNASCASEIVNEIAAVYLFTFFLSAIVSVGIEYPYAIPIAMAIATLYLFPAFLSLYSLKQYDSNDTSTENDIDKGPVTEPFVDSSTETSPTAANPFMNVLISEIKYNPNRPPASDISKPDTSETLDSFFRVQWASDPTDVFGKTQSQRQFVAMPSTSIPNDQGSFMNWLYKIPGKTCKEGGKDACFPGTDGGVIPWLSNNR
jgi:hypothetical protein